MTNKFCKDCRYFQEVEKSEWHNGWIDTNSKCAAPLPDVIMGNEAFKTTGQDGTGCNTAYNMRISGPCGFEGHLFEPKEQGFV